MRWWLVRLIGYPVLYYEHIPVAYLAHYYRWENHEQILAGPQYSNNGSIRWMSCEELLMHKAHYDVSFKDLPAFNLVMLGKQGWKFQTYPHSLACCIFEVRYFPSCSQPRLKFELCLEEFFVCMFYLFGVVHGGAWDQETSFIFLMNLGCRMVVAYIVTF